MVEFIKEKLIAMGAEAKIWIGRYNNKKVIIKERIPKKYRHPEIDKKFRKYRTRREARIMIKLAEIGVPVPEIYYWNEDEAIIVMEYIDGIRLSEILENLDYKNICRAVGEYVAKMHDYNIIHSDLTTSNILYKEGKLYFIDFGLSFVSTRVEDKAVDIHLFREALESKHWKIYPEAFNCFLEGYRKSKNFERVYKRLLDVEKRGRYKQA